MEIEEIETELDAVLERAIAGQRRRVLRIAQEIQPRVTQEELWNPQDVPALATDARWNYEDGILAGWLAAQMAIRSHLRGPRGPGSATEP